MASETVVSRQRAGSIPVTHPNLQQRWAKCCGSTPSLGLGSPGSIPGVQTSFDEGLKENKYGLSIRLAYIPDLSSSGGFVKGIIL